MSDGAPCHHCGRTLAPAAQFCGGCGIAVPSEAVPGGQGVTTERSGADKPTMSISATEPGPPPDDGYYSDDDYYYYDDLPPRRVLPWVAGLVAVAVIAGAILFALNAGDSNTSVATGGKNGPVVMPALLTFRLTGAISVLKRDGITMKQITVLTEPRSDVAPGRVLEQVPLAGTTIDDRVVLTVSRQPDTMPKFVGQGINAARATLSSLQVTLTVEDLLTTDVTDGTILAQSPAPGAPFTDNVTLTVARVPIPTNLGDLDALGGAPYDDDAATIAGVAYTDSLVWNVSVCPGAPAVTADYALGGRYRKLVATAGLSSGMTDPADRVRLDIKADGTLVFTRVLDAQSSVPVSVNLIDRGQLTVTFTAIAGGDPKCAQIHPTLGRAQLLSTVQSR